MRALSHRILTNSINMWITYESKEHKINPNCLDHSRPCHRWLGIVPLRALSNSECKSTYCDLSDYGIWSVERFLEEGFFFVVFFLISLGSPNLNITMLSSKSSQQKYFLFSTVGCDACWSELWLLSTQLRFLPWLLLVHRLQFNFVRTLRKRIAFSKKDYYLWIGNWLILSSKSLKLWAT